MTSYFIYLFILTVTFLIYTNEKILSEYIKEYIKKYYMGKCYFNLLIKCEIFFYRYFHFYSSERKKNFQKNCRSFEF